MTCLSLFFDENRNVKCNHCNANRRRDKAFVLSDKKNELFVYGASCVQSLSSLSPIKLIRWYGFYKHKFDILLETLRAESRIISVEASMRKRGDGVSLGCFVSLLHETVMNDGEFYSAKTPVPTYKRVLSVIEKGGKTKRRTEVKRFVGWVKKRPAHNKFHKVGKYAVLDALQDGVTGQNAAIIAAMYNDFFKSIEYSSAPVLPLGYYSGLAEVVFIEHTSGMNVIELKDAFGRVFVASTMHNYQRGKLLTFDGEVERFEYHSGHVRYHLRKIVEFST